MQKNTTLNRPQDLINRTKAYAATQGTTMTAIIRAHLEALTSDAHPGQIENPLLEYSQGKLSRADAIRLLKLRDYAQLLVALGDVNLPMPFPPPHEIEQQAATFTKIWRQT